MKGDFSNDTFDPTKHYSSVRMQQGRVQLDSDWNQQMDIIDHRLQTETTDFIGGPGAPDANAGFAVTINPLSILLKAEVPGITSLSIDHYATNDDIAIKKATDLNLCLTDLFKLTVVIGGQTTTYDYLTVKESSQRIDRQLAAHSPIQFSIVNNTLLPLQYIPEVLSKTAIAQNATVDLGLVSGLTISQGRYYVDGLLCQNEQAVDLIQQPDYPITSLTEAGFKAGQNYYLAYLDAWQRSITAIEDQSISEPALGGADTTTRSQNISQVKLLPLQWTDSNNNFNVENAFKPGTSDTSDGNVNIAKWNQLTAPSTSLLLPIVNSSAQFDNQLYRIEIHTSSFNDDGVAQVPSIKWSRDNGAITAKIQSIVTSSNTDGTLTGVIKFNSNNTIQNNTFLIGQNVELSSNKNDLLGKPGIFVTITEVADQTLTVSGLPATFSATEFDQGSLRLWGSVPKPITLTIIDIPIATPPILTMSNVEITLSVLPENLVLGQSVILFNKTDATKPTYLLKLLSIDTTAKKLTFNADTITTTGLATVNAFKFNEVIALENGLSIQLFGTLFKSGNYWQIPTRTIINSIRWPMANQNYSAQLLKGITHHYAKLALIYRDNNVWLKPTNNDYRTLFSPLSKFRPMVAVGTAVSNVPPNSIYIDQDGNIGIGTQAPTSKLDVSLMDGGTKPTISAKNVSHNAIYAEATAGSETPSLGGAVVGILAGDNNAIYATKQSGSAGSVIVANTDGSGNSIDANAAIGIAINAVNSSSSLPTISANNKGTGLALNINGKGVINDLTISNKLTVKSPPINSTAFSIETDYNGSGLSTNRTCISVKTGENTSDTALYLSTGPFAQGKTIRAESGISSTGNCIEISSGPGSSGNALSINTGVGSRGNAIDIQMGNSASGHAIKAFTANPVGSSIPANVAIIAMAGDSSSIFSANNSSQPTIIAKNISNNAIYAEATAGSETPSLGGAVVGILAGDNNAIYATKAPGSAGSVIVATTNNGSGNAIEATAGIGSAIKAVNNSNMYATVVAVNNGTPSGPYRCYAFYATGGTYGPFTGAHDVTIDACFATQIKEGFLVSVTGKSGIVENSKQYDLLSTTLANVKPSSIRNDPKLLGVFNGFFQSPDHNYTLRENEKLAIINALGDGRAWVSNINGNLNAGDYITSSEIPGYGMRQKDDILHSYTLGKVIEDIDWDSLDEIIIFNKKKYKICLISLVYKSG